MKTKLEDINITPDWEVIQKMTESEAKAKLYGMASLSSSLMYELFMVNNYSNWQCLFDEIHSDRYIKAMKDIGIVYKKKEGAK